LGHKYYVEWEGERFAEGRFRYAIKGTWLRPRSKEGQKYVVKHSKASYTWNKTDWDTTVKNTRRHKNLQKALIHFQALISPYVLQK